MQEEISLSGQVWCKITKHLAIYLQASYLFILFILLIVLRVKKLYNFLFKLSDSEWFGST